ncbi:hypothetical protein LUZ60_002270 [Juncus effusus]|nr:hypothetical protein LUZ60_002270 [Juncus effusus]
MSSLFAQEDDTLSEFGEKPEVGFLDFDSDKSLHDFNPLSESGPVIITLPFAFSHGKPQSTLVNETASDRIHVRNTTTEPLDIWSISIFSSNPEESFLLSVMKPPSDENDETGRNSFVGLTRLEDRTLQPGQTFTVYLSCKPKEIGLHTSIVHFDIGDEKIERVAFLLAEDKVSRFLFSGKPFSRTGQNRAKRVEHNGFVPGERPTHQHHKGFKYKLPHYNIPKNVREIFDSTELPDVLMEQLKVENYSKYFSMLIIMEELHLEEEMRAYDMECVQMRKRGMYLSLEVPGLAERRPSLVSGDHIFAKLATEFCPSLDSPSYQGFIHRVEADEIFLRFDKSMHLTHKDSNLYTVSFTYNRTNMRRLYKAVNSVADVGPALQYCLLFPSPAVAPARLIKRPPFIPFNSKMNQEQCDSVAMILGCKGTPPYVIYGPPGTGKTVTLVEAILQLISTKPKSRILICSSSNSASDHILHKLLESSNTASETLINSSSIFRLNATSRNYDDISVDLIRFCFFEEMVFKCPPLNALMQYKIIISTYMSASMLQSEGIYRGHFSHVFLDEAGQASEPETMVPITGLVDKKTVLVLAGDPMQLGPVVYSSRADKSGLGTSYLERLCGFDWYRNGDKNYVTKLVRNYRCHPAILDLPSKLFYKGELVACRESNESMDPVYDALGLPDKSFPILFIGIQGCDEREGNNPSWFNRIEASKVVEIISKITQNSDIDTSEIGIITPYRQQVLKLKQALELMEMEDLKVGSVEQFQGQEREVIIVSTVRSTVRHNEFDRVHQLGFLSNYRRFNVAITRAKSLLVIVGNPHVISKDRHWDRLLRYCADNGSYQGCPIPAPESHIYPEEQNENTNILTPQDIPQSGDDTWQTQLPEPGHEYNAPVIKLDPARYGNSYGNKGWIQNSWNCSETGQSSNPEWTQGTWNEDPISDPDPTRYENPEWTQRTWDVDPVQEAEPTRYENPEWTQKTWDVDRVQEPDPTRYENPEWDVNEAESENGQCSKVDGPGVCETERAKKSLSVGQKPVEPVRAVDPVRLVVGKKGLKKQYMYGWSDLSDIQATGWDD